MPRKAKVKPLPQPSTDQWLAELDDFARHQKTPELRRTLELNIAGLRRSLGKPNPPWVNGGQPTFSDQPHA